ncbi:Protein of unknown function [Sanguibacter gelidistatuariae]|uniref:DUF3618 domain-containing protein n=1 Tax=Sanguibacter gelidistatuariae TaxID=1814289 RepID=A0A1G6HHK4_9MICO|nr:DUF3618 domain-containing protein [Sanguibacter gelidistatuariae]SDB93588.1 Protein of unknown function [Sanguibacter gelidistatuariae]
MRQPTPAELSAEVLRARADLAATVDELTTRLHPKHVAAEAASATKLAATDAGTFMTGGGLPDDAPRRARNAKILLGVAAGAIALTVVIILRRR